MLEITENREKSSRSDTGAVFLRLAEGRAGGGGERLDCPAAAMAGAPFRAAGERPASVAEGRAATPEAYGARGVTV